MCSPVNHSRRLTGNPNEDRIAPQSSTARNLRERYVVKPNLAIDSLLIEAARFSAVESEHQEASLYGVTDGKTVGTYLEHKFQALLDKSYNYEKGSSAKGTDFPDLNVDVKVTSIKQPQSSSSFQSARQKILGLGYSLLVFVYKKSDNEETQTARLDILHTIYVDQARTADYQTTRGILEIIDRDGNEEDIVAFLNDRNLPIDPSEAALLASELLLNPPPLGYLTISNALQWRLQYKRAIDQAGSVDGILKVK